MTLRELTLERLHLAHAASETELLALLSSLQQGEGSLSSNSFPGEKVVSYPATQGADDHEGPGTAVAPSITWYHHAEPLQCLLPSSTP